MASQTCIPPKLPVLGFFVPQWCISLVLVVQYYLHKYI